MVVVDALVNRSYVHVRSGCSNLPIAVWQGGVYIGCVLSPPVIVRISISIHHHSTPCRTSVDSRFSRQCLPF